MSLAALDRSTQRNLGKLFSAQALGGSSAPIILSIGGLVGQTLTPDPALATLPVSLYGIGVAVSMIPVSLLMKNAGRKIAYLTGTLLCVLAALLATTAIVNASFWLFCAALGLAGFYGACVQNYRFAASDLVPASHKPNAISLIMLGGLAAAVIGPQTVYWTQNTWASAPFAGSFIGQAILALLAIPILLSLKLPPSHEADINGDARPLWQIAKSPGFITAALAGTVSYALMSFIMTAAPIAMVHQGHSAGDATLGIQWHILAMFGPSFFTGKLIARFGARWITALGLMLLFTSAVTAMSGMEVIHFWGSLILLGLGWNFGFIGATTLLTHTYQPSEKSKVQALNDLLVFGTVAAASLGAGRQFNLYGWYELNLITFPVIAVTLLLLVALPWWQKNSQKPLL
ncbi:MFS transporter [Candidatus Thalassolituus haligoni]|uniref:MFS transporter n=1 Tax=Candidatus Thalassolituus haligoni TaxID=3100113 RepID=UPI0035151F5F|tara:strand:+ start:3333 stop:4538 length:1206 start_codon:yes stop_codon:yes gene_type:complete